MNTLIATGDISAGSITTTPGHISSTSGNMQTRDGTVGSKNDSFQNLSATGMKHLSAPDSRCKYMGLDTNASGEIDICSD